MEVRLIVASGKNAGQKIAISGPKFFIGRSEECHLRPRSELVSRHHCAILVEEGYVAVRDFGSKNGTFVNGQRVKAEHELKNGDRLGIGDLQFDVELVVQVAGKKKPKVHSVQEAAKRMAQASSDEDLDLSNWLGEEEPAGPVTARAETQTFSGDSAPASASPERPAEDQPPEEEKPQAQKRVDAPAPLGGSKKPSDAASSREAAAAVLKNLFHRR